MRIWDGFFGGIRAPCQPTMLAARDNEGNCRYCHGKRTPGTFGMKLASSRSGDRDFSGPCFCGLQKSKNMGVNDRINLCRDRIRIVGLAIIFCENQTMTEG